MSNDQLLEKQNVLQQQTEVILNRLDLISVLSKYGEFKMVGSVALGLMT
jgi:tRNA nucleotidyltransferase (CCA-adding enzyme)